MQQVRSLAGQHIGLASFSVWVVACLALISPLPLNAQRLTTQRRVPVDPRTLGAPRVTLLRQAEARALPQTGDLINLGPGEFLAGRLGDSAMAADSQLRWDLPIRLLGVGAEGERMTLRPVVEVDGGGLRIRPGTPMFRGSIRLGLEDEVRPTESRDLGRTIRMLVAADADDVEPGLVAIEHTNLPFQTVQISVLQPGDSVRVRIRPDFDPDGFDIQVPVVRPRLAVPPAVHARR